MVRGSGDFAVCSASATARRRHLRHRHAALTRLRKPLAGPHLGQLGAEATSDTTSSVAGAAHRPVIDANTLVRTHWLARAEAPCAC